MSGAIVMVGGNGRLESRYRALVEGAGYVLIFNEQSLPRRTPAAAAYMVFATCCSHPQREAAQRLATADRIPIVYLKTTSLSAVDEALTGLRQKRTPRPRSPARADVGPAPRGRRWIHALAVG